MITKVCKICKVEKDISEFHKQSNRPWYEPYCRPCDKERRREYRLKNKVKIAAVLKKWHEDNRDIQNAKNKANYHKNKEAICAKNREDKKDKWPEIYKSRAGYRERTKEYASAWQKEYRKKNKQKLSELNKKYRIENAEILKIKSRSWLDKNKVLVRESKKKYKKMKIATDPGYKIKCLLRGRIYKAIRGLDKRESTLTLLGCSVDYFKSYFESLFTEGMNWDKFMNGEIHMDHIRPCASFDLTIEEEQRKCFNYTNIQPLWAMDNFIKSKKIV
ncbi:MAG TPA: hypothetical protein VGZ90_13295 [Puia sp.]|jgi:hypothetical protein|nr:hypothetical protein [Puia sp.]